jgi:hypothetical protein
MYVLARRHRREEKTFMCWPADDVWKKKHVCVGSPTTSGRKNMYVLARRRRREEKTCMCRLADEVGKKKHVCVGPPTIFAPE